MTGIDLDDDAMAALMRAARQIPPAVRDDFFGTVADLLRPRLHLGLDTRDVFRAINEARRRIGCEHDVIR